MNVNKLQNNLQEMWSTFKTKWSTLAVREKQAVIIGGSILGIIILYMGIWSPYLDAVNNLRERIGTAQKNLAWMQSADKTLNKLEKQTVTHTYAKTPVELLSALQMQTNQAGLSQYMTQLKQASNDSIQVNFQKVEFDKFIALLTTILKTQQVTISTLQVAADGTPGIVDVAVEFQLK